MRALCVADLAMWPNNPAAWRIRRIRKQASSAAAMRRRHSSPPTSNDVQSVSGTAVQFYTKRGGCNRGEIGTTDVIPQGLAHVYVVFFILGFKLRGRSRGRAATVFPTSRAANHGDQTPRHLKHCFGPPPVGLPAWPISMLGLVQPLFQSDLPRPESLSRIAPAPRHDPPQCPWPGATNMHILHPDISRIKCPVCLFRSLYNVPMQTVKNLLIWS